MRPKHRPQRGFAWLKCMTGSLTRPRGSGGAIDVAHNGLVSGWLTCGRRHASVCSVRILLDDIEIGTAPLEVPRWDVPGGRGFAFRWVPTRVVPATIRIVCSRHSRSTVIRMVDEAEWGTQVIGRLEQVTLFHATGWVVDLTAPPEAACSAVLRFGDRRVDVTTGMRRDDVAVHIGGEAIVGFSVNPTQRLNLSVDSECPVLLTTTIGQVLDVGQMDRTRPASAETSTRGRVADPKGPADLVSQVTTSSSCRASWLTSVRNAGSDSNARALRLRRSAYVGDRFSRSALLHDAAQLITVEFAIGRGYEQTVAEGYALLRSLRRRGGQCDIPLPLDGWTKSAATLAWRDNETPPPTQLQVLHGECEGRPLDRRMPTEAYAAWLVDFLDWLLPIARGAALISEAQAEWLSGGDAPNSHLSRYMAIRMKRQSRAAHLDASSASDIWQTAVAAELKDGYGYAFMKLGPLSSEGWWHPADNPRTQVYLGRSCARDGDTKNVCVAGLIDHPSGIGANANASVAALDWPGLHTCTAVIAPGGHAWNPTLVRGVPEYRFLGDHATLLHLPMDLVPLAVASQSGLLETERLIGFFVWETQGIPPVLGHALDLVDEIWTASAFAASEFTAVSETPCHVVGHAVDVGDCRRLTRASWGLDAQDYVVHFSFDAHSGLHRKHPLAVIDAFENAFGTDRSAKLLIKVRNFGHLAQMALNGSSYAQAFLNAAQSERIRLVTAELDRGTTLGLIEMADCYLSLHRCEGFGYTLAEAMALGTPVVATGYSGNMDYMSNVEAWPVRFRLVSVPPEHYFHWADVMQWADPNVEHAVECLRDVRYGDEVPERTAAARERVIRECAPSALSTRYRALL